MPLHRAQVQRSSETPAASAEDYQRKTVDVGVESCGDGTFRGNMFLDDNNYVFAAGENNKMQLPAHAGNGHMWLAVEGKLVFLVTDAGEGVDPTKRFQRKQVGSCGNDGKAVWKNYFRVSTTHLSSRPTPRMTYSQAYRLAGQGALKTVQS